MLAGVATSQTVQGTNNQINVGNLFADQALNVVTVEEGVTATTTAAGNTFGLTAHGADAGVTSNQDNQGTISAHGVVDVSGSMGASSNVATTAVGNGGTAFAAYATVSGFMVQTNTGAVTALGQIEGPTAQAGDVVQSTMAAGNSQGLLLGNGQMGGRGSENNQADSAADGGAGLQ